MNYTLLFIAGLFSAGLRKYIYSNIYILNLHKSTMDSTKQWISNFRYIFGWIHFFVESSFCYLCIQPSMLLYFVTGYARGTRDGYYGYGNDFMDVYDYIGDAIDTDSEGYDYYDYIDSIYDYYDEYYNVLNDIYNKLFMEEMMFGKINKNAPEEVRRHKPGKEFMAGGREDHGYIMQLYKKGKIEITTKQFALYTRQRPIKSPYSAISEYIGDYVIYNVLSSLFPTEYGSTFAHFWQRLRIGEVAFTDTGNTYPSIDYSRSYVSTFDDKAKADKFSVSDLTTDDHPNMESLLTDGHIKQIAAIVLVDLINMNDDRLFIDEYFIGIDIGYHGNLMFRESRNPPKQSCVIPIDNAFCREFVEELNVRRPDDAFNRKITPRIARGYSYITDDEGQKSALKATLGIENKKRNWALNPDQITCAVDAITKNGLNGHWWIKDMQQCVGDALTGDQFKNTVEDISGYLTYRISDNLKQAFPLRDISYIGDYRNKLRLFATNLIESAYYLVYHPENAKLFGPLSPKRKQRAVEIIYKTWRKYGANICKNTLVRLDEVMAHLHENERLSAKYRLAEANIPDKIRGTKIKEHWDFPDYLPVFRALADLVTVNAGEMAKWLSRDYEFLHAFQRLTRKGDTDEKLKEGSNERFLMKRRD